MARPAKTPKELIADYVRALVHAKGRQYAAETHVDYDNGWFRVQHVDGTESKYRRRQILFFTASLLEADFDGEAYTQAIEERKAAEREKATEIELQRSGARNLILQNTVYRPTHNVWVRSFLSLILTAISLGVLWWCIADWQKEKRKDQEAKRKEEREEWNRKLEAAREAASPPSQSRFFPDRDSGFKTALGNLWVGTQLYRKSDYRLFGLVTAVEGDRVEVVLVDSVSLDPNGAHGYAVWFDRSHLTQNCVTKK